MLPTVEWDQVIYSAFADIVCQQSVVTPEAYFYGA